MRSDTSLPTSSFLILTFLAKRLRQFRRQQWSRAIVRRDIRAESTGDFQHTLMIDSARESDHESCDERIAGADRVFHFDMGRPRSG